MSVKILYKNGKTKEFIENECIASQLNDALTVKIDTDDFKKADIFLSAISDPYNFSIISPIKIEVNHKNTIAGAKILKKAKQEAKQLAIAWLVKEIIKNHNNLESKLQEIIFSIKEGRNA